MDFGKEISKKRKEKGLTQADVATQFGITVQAVSKWERGLSKPSVEIYYKLVDFLDLKVETQLTETKKPRFIRFISASYYDMIKAICVGVVLSCSICILFGFISLETAIMLSHFVNFCNRARTKNTMRMFFYKICRKGCIFSPFMV